MMGIMFDRARPLLAFALALCFSITLFNCGSKSSVEDTATRSCSETLDVAIHEHTLDDNPDLCASADEVVVVDFEHKGAEQNSKDSRIAGVDVIPYKIENAGTYTFRFEDADNNPHYAVMKDSAGNQVFRIVANGGPASVELESGSYNLFLYNRGSETVTLFINSQITDSIRINGETSFSLIDVGVLLIVGVCRDCDLSNAYLPYAPLPYVDLVGANLSGANLSNARLTLANLTGANLSGANLYKANLYKANLSNADLSRAKLQSANLTRANLRSANLSGAFLLDADLSFADLTGAWLGLAIWTDGSLCAYESSGGCIKI